jgi:zinc protease
MQDAAIYARDSLRTGAYVLGGAITTGRRIEDVEEWPERIAAVTHAQVQAAAKAVLKDNQSVTAYLLPLRKPKAK